MNSFRWQFWIRNSRRQITLISLLVAIVAAQLPIPVFTASPKNVDKDQSRPFPCQGRQCGCRSAEQCKKKCCCFSADQKLAWAKRNGVDAAEVVASSSGCKADSSTARKSCCSSHQSGKTSINRLLSKATAKPAARSKVVIGIAAQHCRGVAQTLSGQPIFVISPFFNLEQFVESTGERFILESSRIEPLEVEPPVPPPRLPLLRISSNMIPLCHRKSVHTAC